jgi:CRISPR-associated protein Csb2
MKMASRMSSSSRLRLATDPGAPSTVLAPHAIDSPPLPPPIAPAASLFSPQMLVFRGTSGPRIPAWACAAVASAVRGALMSLAGPSVPVLISGHDAQGAPTRRAHLAIVPLPDVAYADATGEIVGVALVLPRQVGSDDLARLHDAIDAWQAHGGELWMGRHGRWQLERCSEAANHPALRQHTWCRASTRWASVTPVVLDRFPGELEDPRPKHRERALQRARELVAGACERIGLPTPTEVEIHRQAVLEGSLSAPRFPSHPERGAARVRVHVRLGFGVEVEGPVLLGAGRYRGLGLLRGG